MSAAATATRRPDFDAQLRREALAAYRETRSYRKAGEKIGRSFKRTHVLVKEALRLEMEEARSGN
jgi:hypothetical protein